MIKAQKSRVPLIRRQGSIALNRFEKISLLIILIFLVSMSLLFFTGKSI